MDKNTRFLKEKFRQYYKENELVFPGRFGRREFGFMFIGDNYMLRHISFKRRNQINNFLIQRIPSHVYYSSAYYEKPNARTMQEKNWLGADLIFDLDADHIKGSENMSYEGMLSQVKKEILKLLNNFLLSDFGFDEKFIKIAFSGGRGYHIHVTDPRVNQLKSSERREIVDYVTGVSLDYEKIFIEESIGSKSYGNKLFPKGTTLRISNKKVGWIQKISMGIPKVAEQFEKMEKDEVIKNFKKNNISEGYANGIYDDLFSGEKGKRGYDNLINENGETNIDIFSRNAHLKRFTDLVKNQTKIQTAGETDEPVTSDIKRLIRMPSSLHGKTGFKVVSLNIEDLNYFEPLNDAIVFPETHVKVEITKNIKIKMKNEKFDLDKGIIDIPEYLAVFLICRKYGNII